MLSCISVCKRVTCVFYVQYLADCNSRNGRFVSEQIIWWLRMDYQGFFLFDELSIGKCPYFRRSRATT